MKRSDVYVLRIALVVVRLAALLPASEGGSLSGAGHHGVRARSPAG